MKRLHALVPSFVLLMTLMVSTAGAANVVVHGIATDSVTSATLEGVTVLIAAASDTTSATGYYSLEVAQDATYPYSASKSGYQTKYGNVTVTSTTKELNIAHVGGCPGCNLPVFGQQIGLSDEIRQRDGYEHNEGIEYCS